MIATWDFIGGVDLPGELAEPDLWEDLEADTDCGLCFAVGADPGTGFCRVCARRLPRGKHSVS